MSTESVRTIPIHDLFVDNERPDDDANFADLIQSIREVGLLHPIVVVETNDGNGGPAYRVVCGRRRLRALKRLGRTEVPATICVMDSVREEMAIISENVHRLDLGAERDAAILRYTELYQAMNPDAADQAAVRKAASLGWISQDAPGVQEAFEAPRVPTPTQAAAKAFGVTLGTVTRAVRRAKGFTDSQRKVLDDAKVAKADLDILASEEEPIVAEVVNLIAAGYKFNDAMSEVLQNDGRTYTGRDGSLEEMDSRLAKLPARRGIGDAEAFDNDCKLFWAIEDEIKKFKKAIDWVYKKEIAGKNPHGLYYRRMELFLEAKNPRHWAPCRCQHTGDDRFSCAYCRSGAYQIGE